MAQGYRAIERRSLTAVEDSLVRWLLLNGSTGADALLQQVDHVVVVTQCTCGCPTIDFEVPEHLRVAGLDRIVSDFYGETADKYQVGVILLVEKGLLSSLEVYDYEGRAGFGLPVVETLR